MLASCSLTAAELRNPELPRLARGGIYLAFLGALLGPMGGPLDKYLCR
jgi:hypothetical protein